MVRALVVGSAPDILLPEQRQYDFVFGANGGARLAVDAGFHVDALVTTAYLCRGETEYSRYVMDGWRGLRFTAVFADVFWYDAETTRAALERLQVPYVLIATVDREHRGQIIRMATGQDLGNGDLESERCSTGMLAACLAVSVAQQITLAGFSRAHGHVGNLSQHENGRHQQADDAVARALAQRVELLTTSPELAERLELARV